MQKWSASVLAFILSVAFLPRLGGEGWWVLDYDKPHGAQKIIIDNRTPYQVSVSEMVVRGLWGHDVHSIKVAPEELSQVAPGRDGVYDPPTNMSIGAKGDSMKVHFKHNDEPIGVIHIVFKQEGMMAYDLMHMGKKERIHFELRWLDAEEKSWLVTLRLANSE